MPIPDPPIRVTALYRFSRFADPAAIRDMLAVACAEAGLRGTLLVAAEGINGTIAAEDRAVARVLDRIRELPGCGDLRTHDSAAAATPFHRMKVRLKREIVTMGVPGIDPARYAGTHVAPGDWNALIDDPATVLIDARNDYEVAIGSFTGAIDPATPSFRDFPAWFRHNRDAIAGRKVAMFCTGGIRCEKATALLKAEGVADVFHLAGGVLGYLETVPAADSRWRGECFVFDERVAVTQGVGPGTYRLCRACRMPVGKSGLMSPLYWDGISCPRCQGQRDDRKRRGYAERHRQTLLADARGTAHVGQRTT